MSTYFQEDFFDPDEGRSRKDDGMDRVWRNNAEWMTLAILCLHQLPKGWHGLPEQWRWAITKAIGAPTDPHAWGSLTNEIIRRGLVRKTGRRFPMQDPTSNHRMTDEYERP